VRSRRRLARQEGNRRRRNERQKTENGFFIWQIGKQSFRDEQRWFVIQESSALQLSTKIIA
jgi:hypothetical protein